MKYAYTFFFLSFIAFSAYAQPTLTTSWVPDAGIRIKIYAFDGTSGLSEGNSGASQTWNLTAYDTAASQVATYVSPASAPQGSTFTGATDCEDGLSTSGYNTYTFDQLNGSVYQLIGLNQPTPYAYVLHYSDPQDIFHLPATFNSTFTDQARVTGTFNSGGPGTISESVTETVTADAYGNLTTASGTFNNVLRFHVVQDIADTTIQQGVVTPVTFHYDTYEWISPSIKGVILAQISHYSEDGVTGTDQGFYSQVLSTGVQTLQAAGITAWSIAPQPCSEMATISLQTDRAGSEAVIELHDLTGREVQEVTKALALGKNSIGIDVSALADGIYMMSISADGRSETQKLAVRH